jgi:Flp pilus assembly protein TadD
MGRLSTPPRRRVWIAGLLFGLSGLLVSQSGCATVSNLFSPPVTALGTTPASDELPSADATKLALTMAQNLEKINKGDEAIEHYERVLQTEPKNLAVLRRLAVLYDRRSPPDFTRADAAYQKLAQARPRDADLYNDWGYSYFLRRNLPEAEQKLRKALQIDPKNNRARCNLGLVLGHEERCAEALQMFHAAGLSEADAHSNLGFIYWSRGKLDDARRECKTALEKSANCTKAIEILVELDRPARPKGKGAAGNRATARVSERTLGSSASQPAMNKLGTPGQPLPAEDSGQGGQRWNIHPGWQPVNHLRPPAATQEELTPRVTTGTATIVSP